MADELGPPLRLRNGATIARRAIRMTAVTASGPGGQHVNRSNTAVELKIAVDELPLDEQELAQLRERLANRIGKDGDLRVESAAHRSQLRNRRTAEERLVALIDDAIVPDVERQRTRASRGARQRARAERELNQRRSAERRWSPGSDD